MAPVIGEYEVPVIMSVYEPSSSGYVLLAANVLELDVALFVVFSYKPVFHVYIFRSGMGTRITNQLKSSFTVSTNSAGCQPEQPDFVQQHAKILDLAACRCNGDEFGLGARQCHH